MKIKVDQIKAESTPLAYVEEVAGLNTRLAAIGAPDFRIDEGVAVDITHYRAGLDLFFTGALRGRVTGTCARCLEEYTFRLDTPFTFVLAPRATSEGGAPELAADDLAFSFFEGEEIDLSPLVHEQTILALPTRPLCREDCRGLCPRCGANLNTGPCGCPADAPDPRLSVLRTLLRSDH